MASSVLGSVAGSGPAKIGRYFTVVSALPSAVFVAWVYLISASGAWTGPVDFSKVFHGLDVGSAVFLGIASFTLALTLHPLQFTLIQILEGYWGSSKAAQRAAFVRVRYHRHRRQELLVASICAAKALNELPADAGPNSPAATDATVARSIFWREALRELSSYPDDLNQILPTRLGNVLRRYEIQAGRPYGIQAIPALSRLGMVAQAAEVEYVQNQRLQLDLAVHTAALGFAASLVTIFAMWRHGGWLLLALAPYLGAYLAYRGAIIVAHEYGAAFSVLIELNRFALYDRLHLPLPENLDDERQRNATLMNVLHSGMGAQLDFEHPERQATHEASGTVSIGKE